MTFDLKNELCEKMLEYIKCATGPDLWIFWEKTFIFKHQKYDRSGPVELCEIMLEYIKCATGPDLWIFWEKTFIFKYQKCHRSGPVELREKMLEYIKCATGLDLWIFWEKTFILKHYGAKWPKLSSGPVSLECMTETLWNLATK